MKKNVYYAYLKKLALKTGGFWHDCDNLCIVMGIQFCFSDIRSKYTCPKMLPISRRSSNPHIFPFFFVFFLGGPTIDLHIYVLKREPRRSEVYTFGPTFRAENSSQGTPAWGVFLGVFQAGGACGLKIFGRRLYNTLPKTNIAPENRPSQ